jgi:murein DD-endopeptidase MepM/ murein hydrolase activator NlpD
MTAPFDLSILQPTVKTFVDTVAASGSSDGRKPFPQFNKFRPFVINELQTRKNTNPGNGVMSIPVTPFARMTSTCVDDDAKYMFFSIGLHGFQDQGQNIFDLTYADNEHDVVGTAVDSDDPKRRKTISSDQLTPDSHLAGSNASADEHNASIPKAARPMPGITSIKVKRQGLGQPLLADIQWICYNRGQLEFLRNHFLIPGQFVILEFGQNFADRTVEKMMDFSKGTELFNELASIIGAVKREGLAGQYGRAKIINDYNKPNKGNYDVVIGQIGNFEINYEPETNIYKCTTHIVSQGENVWGIKIDQTAVATNEIYLGHVTTIKDYFANKMFDTLISVQLEHKNPQVIKEKGQVQINGTAANTIAQQTNVSTNESDYTFLSWNFVFNELLTDMWSVIKDDGIRAQLKDFVKLGNNIGKNDWVGYHDQLISAEPETMLLMNKNKAAFTKNLIGDDDKAKVEEAVLKAFDVFNGAGEFGTTQQDTYGAKINEGVWINSGIIKQCFLDAADIRQAFNSLLMCMNRAVGKYWQLQLFSDEESAEYKIIDYKYGSQDRDSEFYKFNVGGKGECLAVEFDSAFPPELISQMMLVTKYRSEPDQKKKDELLKKYPLLGSTSLHTFVLNWSTLRDGLQQRIDVWRTKGTIKTTTENDKSGDTGTPTRATADERQGQSAQNAKAKIPSVKPDNTKVEPSTKPVNQPYKLDRLPVDGLPNVGAVISSAMGSRLDPVTKAEIRVHNGIDFAVVVGTPVYAVRSGRAFRVETQPKGYGNVVYLKHDDNWVSIYGHLSKFDVEPNIYVRSGDLIGYSGGAAGDAGAGHSTGPHLHFELRKPDGIAYADTIRSLDKTGILKKTDKVVAALNYAKATSGQNDTPNTATPEIPSITEAQAVNQALRYRREEVLGKFGSRVWTLTETNRSNMINRITITGYADTTKPNSFVSPYPTTTSTTVEIMGIAGISVSDGFFVDKIPFTFEKHGVFQVTEVTDDITVKGWRTKVRGYFKMLWYDGQGANPIT